MLGRLPDFRDQVTFSRLAVSSRLNATPRVGLKLVVSLVIASLLVTVRVIVVSAVRVTPLPSVSVTWNVRETGSVAASLGTVPESAPVLVSRDSQSGLLLEVMLQLRVPPLLAVAAT